MLTVGTHAFIPISQMSPNQYSKGFTGQKGSACLASVYTMVERGLSGNSTIPIDKYFVGGRALKPTNLTLGQSTSLTASHVGPQLLLIHGSADAATGGREDHWMLGTYIGNVGGTRIIVADDPYSGVQVTIDATTGAVVNPPQDYKPINFIATGMETISY